MIYRRNCIYSTVDGHVLRSTVEIGTRRRQYARRSVPEISVIARHILLFCSLRHEIPKITDKLLRPLDFSVRNILQIRREITVPVYETDNGIWMSVYRASCRTAIIRITSERSCLPSCKTVRIGHENFSRSLSSIHDPDFPCNIEFCRSIRIRLSNTDSSIVSIYPVTDVELVGSCTGGELSRRPDGNIVVSRLQSCCRIISDSNIVISCSVIVEGTLSYSSILFTRRCIADGSVSNSSIGISCGICRQRPMTNCRIGRSDRIVHERQISICSIVISCGIVKKGRISICGILISCCIVTECPSSICNIGISGSIDKQSPLSKNRIRRSIPSSSPNRQSIDQDISCYIKLGLGIGLSNSNRSRIRTSDIPSINDVSDVDLITCS